MASAGRLQHPIRISPNISRTASARWGGSPDRSGSRSPERTRFRTRPSARSSSGRPSWVGHIAASRRAVARPGRAGRRGGRPGRPWRESRPGRGRPRRRGPPPAPSPRGGRGGGHGFPISTPNPRSTSPTTMVSVASRPGSRACGSRSPERMRRRTAARARQSSWADIWSKKAPTSAAAWPSPPQAATTACTTGPNCWRTWAMARFPLRLLRPAARAAPAPGGSPSPGLGRGGRGVRGRGLAGQPGQDGADDRACYYSRGPGVNVRYPARLPRMRRMASHNLPIASV